MNVRAENNHGRSMNDSDSNILAGLRHESCEGHCPECDQCIPHGEDPTLCEHCGWNDLDPGEEGPHNLGQCVCPTCDEDRAEMRANQHTEDR